MMAFGVSKILGTLRKEKDLFKSLGKILQDPSVAGLYLGK
jgi:hypothetical protein